MQRTIVMMALFGAILFGVSVFAVDWPTGLDTVPLVPTGPRAIPPLPDLATFPVQLVLDDDSAEGSFGLISNARQFLWLNSFANPGEFTLEEIWVLFPNGQDVPLGGTVQLAVYLDPDNDPTNGADLLGTYDVTIQAKDGNTFSVYPLAPTLDIPDTGDVVIGVVSRYFTTGVDPAPTLPVAYDSDASQNRSYFALWPVDPPDPPDLATASTISLFAGAATGNFMIRGFGTPIVAPAEAIPALDTTTLALLAVLLAAAGAGLLLRRH